MSSKLEINIRSLISHCEELAKEDAKSWRLNKYVKSLDTMIDELQNSDFRPSTSIMDEYYTRCVNLKKIIHFEPGSPLRARKLKNKLQQIDKDYAYGQDVIREINQIHKSNYNNELRKELLGGPDESVSSQLRNRNLSSKHSESGTQDMGQAMKYFGDVQERIAEDILSLTQSLREQTETANRIIRRDTEVVSTSSNLSDRNLISLAREAEKLDDHSKRAWKCWMWIMIGMVMMIFIFMVMFMKLMKKKV